MPVILALGRLKQEDKLEPSLGYITFPVSKKKKKKSFLQKRSGLSPWDRSGLSVKVSPVQQQGVKPTR
jgi:hypothetical protein